MSLDRRRYLELLADDIKEIQTMIKPPFMNPQEPMLQFFAFSHLPESLQNVSIPFHALATVIIDTLPRNPERTTALRKLLEAKDCAVRAALYKDPIQGT